MILHPKVKKRCDEKYIYEIFYKKGMHLFYSCTPEYKYFASITDGYKKTRIRQHTDVVAAAERAQVKFIAYTSLGNANESKQVLAPPQQAKCLERKSTCMFNKANKKGGIP